MTIDVFSPYRVQSATGLLRMFCDADVLASADVHTAGALGRAVDERDESVLLAAALAVRAVRLGHVFVDLSTIADTATTEGSAEPEPDTDLAALDWPDPTGWLDAVAVSPLTIAGLFDNGDRPLRLVGYHLYLDRYWHHERRVIADLLERAASPAPTADEALLDDGIARLFGGDGDGEQALAARTTVTRRLAVVAGGPGTGKTTTVARLLALMLEQAGNIAEPFPRIALAAPTGKAAARLSEAVHAEASMLATSPAIRSILTSIEATTLHRLLGWKPGSRSRFRHDAANQLPHSVVVVDESSMVSLSMMSMLLSAVRPSTSLVLVGDPQQLASVEAGAVLGDVVGPGPGAHGPLSGAVVELQTVHRFGQPIYAVAAAIRAGDGDATIAALRAGANAVTWIDLEVTDPAREPQIKTIEGLVVAAGRDVAAAAEAGDARGALEALRSMQVLCAHRRGQAGAVRWRIAAEHWLRAAGAGHAFGGSHAGQALLVTKNDAAIGVFNGDTGVVIDTGGGRLRVAFERAGEPLMISPSRLDSVEALSAMTIHKAQGSQFGTAVVVLPSPSSRVLTRELLYTGITRAEKRLVVVGSEAALRAAVARPISRASGLRDALWSSASVTQ